MSDLDTTSPQPAIGQALAIVPADDQIEQLEGEVAELERRVVAMSGELAPEQWTLEKVRDVVAQHDMGDMRASMRLRRAQTKDARVYGALGQRTSAPVGLPLRVSASKMRNGKGVSATARDECEDMFSPRSPTCPPSTRRRILEDLIMSGVCIFQNLWRPRADGERIDLVIELWPLEFAFWDESYRRWTLVTTDGLLQIEHGCGRWGILEPRGPRSFLDGAVRVLSEPWSDRRYGIRYRAGHAKAHGTPAAIGEPPAGVLTNSPEGKSLQRLMSALRAGSPAGVRPPGSKTEYLEVKSNAWQVFNSIVKNTDDDIQIALLGQSGTGEKGGVYTATKGPFNGVRADYVQSDCTTLEVGIQTASVRPWAALNFGLEFEPTIAHDVPDPEEDMKHAAALRKHQGFALAVRRYREAGFVVDDEVVARIAAEFTIAVPPKIGPLPAGQKPLPEGDSSIDPDVG